MKLLFPFIFSFLFIANIDAQQIAVDKDSLKIFGSDSLFIYNVGSDTLIVDSLYTVKKRYGYWMNVILPDSAFIHYLIDAGLPLYILNFKLAPGDTAKFIFTYVDLCPVCVSKEYDNIPNFNDTLIFLSNSIVDDSLAIYVEGIGKLSGVEDEEIVAKYFQLYQNYPNPFNPTTKISYTLKQPGEVKLIVYDLSGREIITLVNKFQNSGEHSVNFDGKELSSGVYFYKLKINNLFLTKKMILMR